jgi:hypothetical protein
MFDKFKVASHFLGVILFSVAISPNANAQRIRAHAVPECYDDVQKFCGPVATDADKRRACMRAHGSQLSKECIAALKEKGMAR